MIDYHDQPTRGLFARELLRELGVPKTAKNMIAMIAWMEGEGTKARNNPLATTMNHLHATNFNSAGVKNYASLADGILATLNTLRLPPYARIRTLLAKGTSVQHVAAAIEASPWGTQQVPWEPVNASVEEYAAIRIHS